MSKPTKTSDLQRRKFLHERGIEFAKLAELTLQHSREWMANYLLELAHTSFELSLDSTE